MEIRHLTAWGLANGITEARRKDIKAWKNPYSEELCRRARKLSEYRKNPETAVKAAARGYGIVLY